MTRHQSSLKMVRLYAKFLEVRRAGRGVAERVWRMGRVQRTPEPCNQPLLPHAAFKPQPWDLVALGQPCCHSLMLVV
jgi:hypothetical protein